MKKKLILVGSGMAGSRFLEHLLSLAPDVFDIRVFNKEPVGGYNRIMLSPVLAGEKCIEEIMTHDASWFAQQGVRLHTGTIVTDINTEQQEITTDLGQVYAYDHLVLATGSNPFVLPVEGNQLEGVVTFRDIRDVNLMIRACDDTQKAVVIGGGLLGLEAAYGLQKRGMDVTVVHRGPVLMNMQMDAEAGAMLQKTLEAKGLNFEMNAETDALLGEEAVEAVRFKDGRQIDADLVVMAVGIRPNIGLAASQGIAVNRGILVNDQLQTSANNVFALGECTEHRGQCYGLVAPLYEQAEVLAKTLAGEVAEYVGSTTSTMLKVTGVELFSAGQFEGSDTSETLVFRDKAKNSYRKVVLEGNRIIGSVLFGDTTDGNWIFDLLKTKEDVSTLRETLIFGKGYA